MSKPRKLKIILTEEAPKEWRAKVTGLCRGAHYFTGTSVFNTLSKIDTVVGCCADRPKENKP